ncbi:hypothetical protein [Microvirga tunisiensis]|uniref:Uncharacterized protein n=1 Tax=Microvirga tunisiensis TaxID=2108360 RepID=A0A5N7MAJ4_9HYPH|nr:hypothetical protein [Microvirga tunisiensis]MPR05675.1 hypothetical protein [Microvirga tunisiensis]MPR23875.1 hypothetical protein [Microvirga tunisiensis]
MPVFQNSIAGYLQIGEVQIAGADLPLYVTAEIANRAIDVDPNYSGIDDPSTRTLLLYEAVSSAIALGRTDLSIEVADRSWSRNPEEIPQDRIGLALAIDDTKVVISSGVRQISRGDPMFNEIALSAEAALAKLASRTLV